MRSGELKIFCSQLNQIDQILDAHNHFRGAQYYIQRGLYSGVQGDYVTSIQYFKKAEKLLTVGSDLAFANLINILISKENMGLGYEEELRDLQNEIASKEKTANYKENYGQIQASQMRLDFVKGSFQQWLPPCKHELVGIQSHYFSAWMASLPHFFSTSKVACSRDEIQKTINKILSMQNAYQACYRIHTLQMHPESTAQTETPRRSAAVERIYLWVWQWLMSPNEQLLKNILDEKHKLEFRPLTTFTNVEFKLLRNALGWLATIGGFSLDIFLRSFQSLKIIPGASPAILDDEFIVISAVNGCEESMEASRHLENKVMLQMLKEVRVVDSQVKRNYSSIRIDMSNRELQLPGSDHYSKFEDAQIRLLTCFSQNQRSRSVSEIYFTVYGLKSSESQEAYQKISKLLNSTNTQLATYLKFSRRNDQIYLDSSIKIETIFHSVYVQNLYNTIRSKDDLMWNSYPIKENEIKFYSRKDLQDQWKLSKSSANRKIKKLLDENKLKSKGSGPSTRYHVFSGFEQITPEKNTRGEL